MSDNRELEPHEERIQAVKTRLRETGGFVEPWMYNVLFSEQLRQIWTSGEWIGECL